MVGRARGAGVTSRRFETTTTASINNISVNELGVAPGPGSVGVWAASDQSDGLITIRIGGHLQANRQIIGNRGAAAPINTEDQAPDGFAQVRGGERITVDYVEVTAATARIIILWLGADLGLS